jgi:hypothetical protein
MEAAFVGGRGKDAKLAGIPGTAKSGRLCRDNLRSDPRLPQIWHYRPMKRPSIPGDAAGRAVTC